ncbi:uncharacterized protein LOC131598638 [Vicia villosa]|uniref:uncharacterized protein LOC131598638 n=1 Tax=Vicia villosa TaxID=3911 RepID=UPI00273B0678|nr:uncharacterized protein LOC131598638 [Vicia villosa]
MKRLEANLQKELSIILKQEELMWFQRGRTNWLADGDRNTRYYHMKIITRRKGNKILMLKDDEGNWVEDHDALEQLVTNYFKTMFDSTNLCCQWSQWSQTEISYPKISADIVHSLDEDIKAEEVIQPHFVNQFRPISLCNTIYKIVTKVIVERLKPRMQYLVSPFQTGFVPGRSIHENIIIATEAMHNMSKKKGKKGYFAIKIDLAKAYDKINWKFIWRVLTEIGLPDNLINIIMHGVTSVETDINWNGSRSDFFRPKHGIRQGDPMSPYLFMLCMDKPSHIIEQKVHQKEWRGVQLGSKGLGISHLMFADNLLMFGEVNERQMKCVINSLDTFCKLSGQEVSREKYSILFIENVKRSLRMKLVHLSGYRETSNFGKYLGIPLSGKNLKRHDYNYIIEQISTKLASWKARNLSMAGRITLAKSVIEATPTYPMMTNILPKACIKEIQRLQISWKMMNNDANLWCNILRMKCMPNMLQSSVWRIGDGADIHAWNDILIGMGKNIVDYHVDIPTILPPLDPEERDSIRYVGTMKGDFSVGNNYRDLQHDTDEEYCEKTDYRRTNLLEPSGARFRETEYRWTCGKDSLSGCGGVIRDSRGCWLCGFSKLIGYCSAFTAEAWAIFEGLKLTLARGYVKIIVNMDARKVIEAILRKDNKGYSDSALIQQIRLHMSSHDVVILEHTFWEVNSIADKLARDARLLNNGFQIFEEAPDHIMVLLQKDSVGSSFDRVVDF